MAEKLRIGKISYLNLMPIFRSLNLEEDDRFEIIEGFPSELNRMLREGELDISPSSSIEYLRGKDRYKYIEGHSISSRGAIKSLLLFSRVPIENICEHDIMATYQSETTVAMLKILLSKFYGFDCAIKITDEPFYDAIDKHSAYLSIGDDALRALYGAHILGTEKPADCHAICTINHQAFYVYDIAELWSRHTGLPSVLALWIYRADMPEGKLALLMQFKDELDRALKTAMDNLDSIAKESDLDIPPAEIADYWRGMCYSFPSDCKQGLALLEKHLIELDLL